MEVASLMGGRREASPLIASISASVVACGRGVTGVFIVFFFHFLGRGSAAGVINLTTNRVQRKIEEKHFPCDPATTPYFLCPHFDL
jgi:hypothetical protein